MLQFIKVFFFSCSKSSELKRPEAQGPSGSLRLVADGSTLACVAGGGFQKNSYFSTLKLGLLQLRRREAVFVLG